jgi:23S rRNA pseudouridine1911/1915/1917 synthase
VAEGTSGARESILSCRPLDRPGQRTLVEVTPLTGRSHQIRVQLSHHRLPIVGDAKYGSTEPFREGCIALHASHPTRDETITVAAPVPGFWR